MLLTKRRQEQGASSIWLLPICAACCFAGPKEFGLTQLDQALAARHLEVKVVAELGTDPPETFQIEPSPAGSMVRITGGDLRGLMYGLIEAAEQIRATGKLTRAHGTPSIALRGVRLRTPVDWGKWLAPTFAPLGAWPRYMQTLALARFNRVTVTLDRFPAEVDARVIQNFAQAASAHGVDFILGLPSLNAEQADALPGFLAACPLVRGVEVLPDTLIAAQRAQREAGRLISIDLTERPTRPIRGVSVRALVSIPFENASDATSIRRRLLQVDPTTGFRLEITTDESTSPLYWLWGRLAYSLKP